MSAFGKILKRIREEKEMTRQQLGEASGLSRMQIYRLETGKQGASWETVQALAAALGVTCEAFNEPPHEKAPKKPRKK